MTSLLINLKINLLNALKTHNQLERNIAAGEREKKYFMKKKLRHAHKMAEGHILAYFYGKKRWSRLSTQVRWNSADHSTCHAMLICLLKSWRTEIFQRNEIFCEYITYKNMRLWSSTPQFPWRSVRNLVNIYICWTICVCNVHIFIYVRLIHIIWTSQLCEVSASFHFGSSARTRQHTRN